MGLDMYLNKKTYIGNKYRDKKSKMVKLAVPKEYDTYNADSVRKVKNERIVSVTEEVAYWRKANQIHRWFVNNVQDGVDDCKEYSVSSEDLQRLLDACKHVRDSIELVEGKVKNGQRFEGGKLVDIYEDGYYVKDVSTAMELLPPSSGFFFGSEGLDQWYLEDINYTIEIIEQLLEEDPKAYYEYQSSW